MKFQDNMGHNSVSDVWQLDSPKLLELLESGGVGGHGGHVLFFLL